MTQTRKFGQQSACLIAACCGLSLIMPVIDASPAHADLSSWFWRSDETTKSKPNSSNRPQTKVKPIATPPASPSPDATTAAQPQTTPDGKPAMPAFAPVSGDNAAYIAFEQGQFLTALKLAEVDAGNGVASAHTLIGRIYSEGLGVRQDEAKAADAYAKASELGDIQGTFALALMYAGGRGVTKDRKKAAELFEKAARTGHPEANYNLGMLFLKGDGKPENPYRAAMHLRYAAEKGIAQAQYDLAALYQSGTGVEPDALEASRWLSRASNQGLAAAEYEYAVQLLKGLGLTRDEKRIVTLLQSAARKGVAGAQNRLAYLYLDGILVEKNPIEAAKWARIARRNGVNDAALDKSLASLTVASRQKGEKLADEWLDMSEVMPVQ